jgi:hypothetical protein
MTPEAGIPLTPVRLQYLVAVPYFDEAGIESPDGPAPIIIR